MNYTIAITTIVVCFRVAQPTHLMATQSNPANEPPKVAILFPPDNVQMQHFTPYVIRAGASDPDGGVTRVVFYSGAEVIGEDTNAPFTLDRTVPLSQPPFFETLSAVAVDDQGATSRSAPVVVKSVLHSPGEPIILVSAPSPLKNLLAPAEFSITADVYFSDGSDNPLLVYVDSTLVAVAPDFPYTVRVSNVLEGIHLLEVGTTNRRGALTISSNRIDNHISTVRVVRSLLSLPEYSGQRGFEFQAAGRIAEQLNVIEASFNLREWLPLATNTPSTNTFRFQDLEATNHSHRFYRLRLPP